MKLLKSVFAVSAVLAGLSLSGQVMAACSFTEGSANGTISPQNIPPLDVSGPIGSELYRGDFLTPVSSRFMLSCTSGQGLATSTSGFVHLGGGVYDTGISGIGFKYFDSWTGLAGLPFGFDFGGVSGGGSSRRGGTITFIKTGPITAGGFMKSGLLIRSTLANHSNFIINNVTIGAPIQIVIANPTCAATTPTVNVDLGSVNLQDLAVTGRSIPKDFNIGLLCSGGDGTTTIDVHVTLTDQSNPANRSTELSLAPGATATGIALEVNNKNGAVNFGADSDAPGNPGQWFEGAANNGAFTIPLSANYVKTAASPTPGSANAVATYTISYQ